MKPRREKPLERLIDADPSWWVPRDGDRTRKIGIIFDCPIHEHCSVGVPFSNPIGGGSGEPMHSSKALWERTGEDFDTLTISPSIHVLGEVNGPDGCQWHGYVRNGRFETCGDSQ